MEVATREEQLPELEDTQAELNTTFQAQQDGLTVLNVNWRLNSSKRRIFSNLCNN